MTINISPIEVIIQKIDVTPSDVLVVKVPNTITRPEYEYICDSLREYLTCKFIITRDDVQAYVLSNAQAES